MAVDFEGTDYSNGKAAATVLQRSPNDNQGLKPGFINKVRGMDFAFTEREYSTAFCIRTTKYALANQVSTHNVPALINERTKRKIFP